MDGTFNAHVFEVNDTFPAVKHMVLWFLLAFTVTDDVVWQLNATNIPFFSECARARLPWAAFRLSWWTTTMRTVRSLDFRL